MKLSRLILVGAVAILILMLLPLQNALCQDYIEYKIQINLDSSAAWMITKVSDINATIDIEGFQQRVEGLIEDAIIRTGREMSLDVNSLQVSDEISWETQSRTTVYLFKWQNFTAVEDGKIIFGDVFHASGFFSQLYGHGAIQIIYPSEYSIQSVSPAPNERDDSTQTLGWFRTQDFINGEPNVILENKPQPSFDSNSQQYVIIGLISVIIAASIIGFYAFRRRKPKSLTNSAAPIVTSVMETEEEKVVKIIKSSGGSIHQSDIAERCRFSKAKTSQLLASLERKGVITRYKRGRDKIVTLKEEAAGEKS
jgi:uncharacterized membrane protein